MKKDELINESRREMLKGLSTAVVAGAVVSGVSGQAVATETPLGTKKVLQKGYHETQHIRDYYDTL